MENPGLRKAMWLLKLATMLKRRSGFTPPLTPMAGHPHYQDNLNAYGFYEP